MKALASALVFAAAPVCIAVASAGEAPVSGLCVSVEPAVADPQYFACLSEELKTGVAAGGDTRRAREHVIAARTSQTPAAQGLYTQAATRLRLGPNFGHSVIPYRPAVEYRSPLLPPGAGNGQ